MSPEKTDAFILISEHEHCVVKKMLTMNSMACLLALTSK
jgi:hypothetical protein